MHPLTQADSALAAQEKTALVKMRTELEKAANRLEQERLGWEKRRVSKQGKGWARSGDVLWCHAQHTGIRAATVAHCCSQERW